MTEARATDCQLVPAEPKVRVPHMGGGYTLWTLAEADALHASLGECIRQARHEGVRVKVTWSDERINTALSVLCDWRDGNIHPQRPFAPDSELLLVTIDCLRAVLGGE